MGMGGGREEGWERELWLVRKINKKTDKTPQVKNAEMGSS